MFVLPLTRLPFTTHKTIAQRPIMSMATDAPLRRLFRAITISHSASQKFPAGLECWNCHCTTNQTNQKRSEKHQQRHQQAGNNLKWYKALFLLLEHSIGDNFHDEFIGVETCMDFLRGVLSDCLIEVRCFPLRLCMDLLTITFSGIVCWQSRFLTESPTS